VLDDDALTDESLAALDADPIGCGDDDRVRVRRGLAEDRRHRRSTLAIAPIVAAALGTALNVWYDGWFPGCYRLAALGGGRPCERRERHIQTPAPALRGEIEGYGRQVRATGDCG
jgi:hypothetical protein